MNNLIIFLSKRENYFESARKIKNNIKLDTEIIYIEDFVNAKDKNKILENKIIYLLCNSDLIKKLVNISQKINCYIYNKGFFEKNYTKLEVQKLLISNEINAPKLFSFNEIDELNYPVFCKENKHAGTIFKAYKSTDIRKFLGKNDKENFYIEEIINGQQEIKFYCIKEKIYCKDKINIPSVIKDYCNKITNILKLEIFSIDVIKRNDFYIIIDVNPSAGFYLLDDARKSLIDEIEKINEVKK